MIVTISFMLLAADLPHDPAASLPASAPIKAKEAAKKAELTPIVPSPNDLTKPAYQLYLQTDLPILGIGLAIALARFVSVQPAYCAPLCDRETLNPIDRVTAGYYSHEWGIASDIGLYAIGGASAIMLMATEGFLPAVNDLVVILESALAAQAVASIATFAVARPRPLLYGEIASIETRTGADAGMSFLSSHAASAFALAVSTFMTLIRLHPQAKAVTPWIALGLGLAASSFVAVSRVMGGKHFITDVIGGAIVGSSLGVVIPAIHGAPVRVVPKVTQESATLGLGTDF